MTDLENWATKCADGLTTAVEVVEHFNCPEAFDPLCARIIEIVSERIRQRFDAERPGVGSTFERRKMARGL